MDLSGMLAGIAEQSKQSIPVDETDYIGDDGLIFCGKCKTPKQTRLKLFDGREVTPMCLCKCMAESRDAENAARGKEERIQRIKRMRKTGFPEAEMSRWTFASDDLSNEEITKAACNYVKHFREFAQKGKGLLLFGTVGTGKTFTAACIANALIDRGFPCLVTNFARLINTIQGMYEGKQQYIDSLDQFDLLVIDDLAAERDTEFMSETVFNIIDARYRSGKPLIVTTNLSMQDMLNTAEVRKQRIYSRILEMCIPLEVKGKDRRKVKRDDYLMNLLKM